MHSEIRPASAFRHLLPSDYRKKTVAVYLDYPAGHKSVNSYWDGGSRTYYTLYPRGGARPVEVSKNPGFPGFKNQTVDLCPGDVMVETGIFCGKPATARIYFIVAPKVVAEEAPGEAFRAQRNHDMGDAVREALGISKSPSN